MPNESSLETKEELLEIIRKKKDTISECYDTTNPEISEKKWAPAELQSGWAEPIIGYLAAQNLNLTSSLFLINTAPRGTETSRIIALWRWR